MKKKLIVLSSFALGLVPFVALAQAPVACSGIGTTQTVGLASVLCKLNQILAGVVPVLIALGVVYFLWGVVSYVIGTDEETKKSAREKIIYGLIGLAVVVGVWGLVKILTSTFGVDTVPTSITVPVVPGY